MSASEMRIGDQTQVRLTVKDETDAVVDLSAAPTIHFIFRKPSGVKLTRTPSFETDGADGVLTYTFALDELDEEGLWKVQVYVELPFGVRRSTIYQFDVLQNL